MSQTLTPYERAPRHWATQGRRVGFYGCQGRLVRVGTEQKHPPSSRTILCPACGREHVVKLMWRMARPGEAVELELVHGQD